MNRFEKFSKIIKSHSESRISDFLLDIPDDQLGDLLFIATKKLNLPVVKKIMNREPNVMALLSQGDDLTEPTPVHFCLCDDVFTGTFNDQESAFAVKLDLLKLLLANGADPNWISQSGSSVLDIAIKSQHPSVVRLLLEQGANPNYSVMDSAINLVLHTIEDVKKRSRFIRMLVNHGANPNGTPSNAPIFYATIYNQIDSLKLLLSLGADPKTCDEQGYTILDLACKFSKPEVIEMCQQQGWMPSAEQQLLIEYSRVCAENDYAGLVQLANDFPNRYLTQQDVIRFSFSATQIGNHDFAIAWADRALKWEANSSALERAIAASVYASDFQQAIKIFHSFESSVAISELDAFAKSNLLVAGEKTANQAIQNLIFTEIENHEPLGPGTGLLYFNAACVSALRGDLQLSFHYFLAAKINKYNSLHLETAPELGIVRAMPECAALIAWNNLQDSFYVVYDNDKELWYFNEKIIELDFVNQSEDILTCLDGSQTQQVRSIAKQLLEYKSSGFNPVDRPSAALSSLTEDICLCIMDMLEYQDDFPYRGFRFYVDNKSKSLLSVHWSAYGVGSEGNTGRRFRFRSYIYGSEAMFDSLAKEIAKSLLLLAGDQSLFVELPYPKTYQHRRIQLGN